MTRIIDWLYDVLEGAMKHYLEGAAIGIIFIVIIKLVWKLATG